MKKNIKQNKDEAKRFIEAIHGSMDATVTFQTFDDQKAGRVEPEVIHGTLEDHWARLVRLNNAGAGIFVMVNPGDGKRRKEANVTAVNSVFLDLDGNDPLRLRDCHLQPHVITLTSIDKEGRKHFQAFWKLNPVPINGDLAERKDEFRRVQSAMCHHFDGDPAITKDLNRVMRVPGFLHQKFDPQVCQIVQVNSHEPYEYSEIKEWLGVKDEPTLKKKSRKPRTTKTDYFQIPEGKRNKDIFKYCAKCFRAGLNREEVMLLAHVEAEKCVEGSHPFTEEEVEKTIESAEGYCNGGLSGDCFDPPVYIDYIRSQVEIITLYGEQYFYEDGVYSPWPVEELKGLIWELSHRTATVTQIKSCVELLGIETYCAADDVNPPGLLNIRNGIINPETGEVLPHSPDQRFTLQLPVTCENPPASENPRPPNCPHFNRFLERSLPDPAQRDVAWEVLGYCVTTDCRLEKAIILYGWGSNGKTVFLNILRAMLVGLVSELRLTDLGHRYRPSMLINKLVNISAEGEAVELVDDAVVKSVISGEPMAVEKKYEDPIVIKPFAKLVIATNHLPRSRDKSHGYFRRWLILHFDQEIKEEDQDKELSQKIIENELDEIFYGALIGLRRLRRQNGFTVPESSKDLLEEYKRQTNPAISFIEEHLAVGPGGSVFLQDIYHKYTNWCERQGHRNALNQPNLRKEIERHMGITATRLTGGRIGFKGLVLVQEQRLRDIHDSIRQSRAR